MDKGLLGFILFFVLLIGASLAFANTDQISPAIAQAEAEQAMGPIVTRGVEQGALWVGKILLGALFAGIVAAVYTEARKAYRTWTRSQQARRWQAGPNAQWQPKAQASPHLRREDLMLLALMNNSRMPSGLSRSLKPARSRPDADEDEINLEF